MEETDAQLQVKKRARRRLVGAVAFVSVVAVVLPMVMDHQPRQVVQDVEIRIPGQDEKPFAPKFSSAPVDKQVEPMVDKPAVTIPASEAKPAVLPLAKGPDVREKSGEKMPEKLPEKSARIEKPLEKLVPKESDAKRAAAILAGQSDLSSANSAQFLVLIGAFSNEANVKNIRTKLSEQGIKTFSEPLDTPQGKKTRVRAGPFASREAADKALEKMQKIGVSGVVSAKQ